MNLLAELRRRNVFRVALFYMVSAWLLVQVAETVLPLFEVPDGVLRGLILVMMLGFIPALVFAWAFELTPEGLKREKHVQVDPKIKQHTAQKLNVATLIVALLAVGLMLADRLMPQPALDESSRPGSASQQQSAEQANETASIAVLPFVNMSPDPQNEFFADGISEEILNLLSRVPQLQVIGRTSSFRFKGRDEDLPAIGRALGVTHLLEGSVRKVEQRVRITAQLVKASDGVRLWGASWDRDLDNVFQVQDEIGREVTAALRRQLAADVANPTPLPTTDPESYALYLKARTLLTNRGAENMHKAVEFLEQATAIDPEYAPAHAVLAQSLALLPLYDFSDPKARPGWIERAVQAAQRALELNPDLAMAWSALGTAQAHHLWDWKAAGDAFDRALELEPTNAEILNLAGDFNRIIRNIERAQALESEALRLDPLRAFNHTDLAHAYQMAGDCNRALELARSGNALDPAMPYGHLVLVLCNGELGQVGAMRTAVEQARDDLEPEIFDFLMLDFALALVEARWLDAEAIIQSLSEKPAGQGRSSARIGYGWLQLGKSEAAQTWLEKAYAERDWPLVISEPIEFDLIAADPVARSVLQHAELSSLYRIRKSNERDAVISR